MSENTFFDAQGCPADNKEAALDSAVASTTVTSKACLELINGRIKFIIEVDFNPNSYPYLITGGKIISGICGAPWEVTGGSMGTSLSVDAKRLGSGRCADTITIIGNNQFPSSWSGTYGFNGASNSFSHTTLFKQFASC